MTADLARTSAAFAASLAIHVVVLAMLIGRGAVLLTIGPSPILLTFVEAAHRTAGPGEPSSQLRSPPPRASPQSLPEPGRPSQPKAPEASLSSLPAASRPKPAPPLPAVPAPAPPRALRESKPMAAPAPRPLERKPAPPAVAAAPDTAATDAGTPGKRGPASARPAPGAPGTASASASAASGTGSDARATSPSWAPVARIRYEEVLYAWIDRHKQYPLLAQRRGIEGSGSVRVRIDRDGRVLERSLVRSTGAPVLDEAALDIVRRASPFPAVPTEYPGANFEFVAPIEYRLR